MSCLTLFEWRVLKLIKVHVIYSTIQAYLEFWNENFHLPNEKILDDNGFFEKAQKFSIEFLSSHISLPGHIELIIQYEK